MAMTYIVVIIGVLIMLNTYPVMVSQNFIFQSKMENMHVRTALYSSTLGNAGELQSDTVSRIIGLLDDGSGGRVIVIDASLRAIYDSSETANAIGKTLVLQETRAALEGNDFFHARYTGEAISCAASMPIIIGGYVAGAVCVYETDLSSGALLADIQQNLLRMSLLITAVSVLIALLLSRFFSARISKILGAMRRAHEGDYTARAAVRGSDELAQIAAELGEMSAKFARVEEMRRRFVSDASHELKTPLASVKLLVDSIVQNEDMPPDMMREFARDIGDETDRLSRLSERLLDITRLDSNRSEKLEKVDLAPVVRRVAHTLEPLAGRDNVKLSLQIESDCMITATNDGAFQIVYNLVENAIKYNLSGGSVSLFLYKNDAGVNFIVADTGIGIPAEDIARIFDRFYRVDKARSREAGGSGLGLAIVDTAVRRYGGTINVESKRGEGTRISVLFPVKEG